LVQDGTKLKQISQAGSKFTLIANQTPFYGESGGQMGDIGIITSPHCKIKVINTMKYLGKVIGHVCELKEGLISPGDEIKLEIDTNYRKNLRIHHTATHILHAVLRDVLGRHVTQKGSLVAQDKLRFDISHPKALTKAEIHLIESKVNSIISDNSKVNTKLMSTDQAIESGAMALFGEKYDSEVRVVSLGADLNVLNPYSFELCGGTHAQRTGDIGAFKIISEGAIAAGIRRIEAVCGNFAFASILESEELLEQVMNSLKSNKTELLQKVDTLVGNKKDLEKKVEKLQMDTITLSDKDLTKQIVEINDARLIYREFDKIDPKIIRMSAENLVKKHDDLIVVYISKNVGKLAIVVAVSNKASKQYHAGKLANQTADFVGGSGGGQATLAQAGGVDLSKLPQLKSKVEEIVTKF
jgi:alanyl-tRNA synthetase